MKNRKLVKWLCLISLVALLISIGLISTGNAATEKTVKLSWYFPNTPQTDQDSVTAEINKILKPKINAEVTVNNIDWGAYDQKMKVMIASGEAFDTCYSGFWTNDFLTNVNKGAFLPIDDLIAKYAPYYRATAPKSVLPALQVKGKSYGMMVLQVLGRGFDFMGAKKYFTKYDVDPAKIKNLEDFTPLFTKIVANEPGITPIAMQNDGMIDEAWKYYGLENFSNDNPVGVYMKDSSMKVINLYDTPEFKQHVKLMRDWYQKGFIRKDAATFKELRSDMKARKYAVWFMTVNPDSLANQAPNFSDNSDPKDVVSGYLTKKFITTAPLQVCDAISVNSKNAAKTVQMLDLFYDSKNYGVKLMNLMEYGVEGKHYKKVDKDHIAQIQNSGYWLDCGWEHGDLFNCYYTKPGYSWDTGRKMNKEANVSKLLGFTVDPTPIKSELAQCQSVLDEFRAALVTGSVDPDQILPQFVAKLKGAGVDKIIAEYQKQIDTWKASQK